MAAVPWKELVLDWPESARDVRAQLMKQPLPLRQRGRVWCLMAAVADKRDEHEGLYDRLKYEETPVEEKIRKDIHRTFAVFEENDYTSLPEVLVGGLPRTQEQKYTALRNILRALSVYDKRLGYHQGLNFIAGVLVLQVGDEEDAFWLLVYILHDQRMVQLFDSDSPLLQHYVNRFSLLLRRHLPRLHLHFQDHNFGCLLYTIDWFTTLFSYSLQFNAVMWVFDLFLAGLPEVMFRCGLTVLALQQEELLQLSFNDLMVQFKGRVRMLEAEAIVHHMAASDSSEALKNSDTLAALAETKGGDGRIVYDGSQLIQFIQWGNLSRAKAELAEYEFPPEVLSDALFEAAARGEARLVYSLLLTDGLHAESALLEGMTIMHMAVLSNFPDVLRVLLYFFAAKGRLAAVLNTRDAAGRTPLQLAAGSSAAAAESTITGRVCIACGCSLVGSLLRLEGDSCRNCQLTFCRECLAGHRPCRWSPRRRRRSSAVAAAVAAGGSHEEAKEAAAAAVAAASAAEAGDGSLGHDIGPLPVDDLPLLLYDAPPLRSPVDRSADPTLWVPDRRGWYCASCKVQFGAFVRRHHCRRCGHVFCGSCTPHSTALPPRYSRAVRVCGNCWHYLKKCSCDPGYSTFCQHRSRDLAREQLCSCEKCAMARLKCVELASEG